METLYRIEHKPSGLGLFHAIKVIRDLEGYGRETRRIVDRHYGMKTPSRDFGLCPGTYKHLYCAYSSKQEMLRWVMPSEIKMLVERWNFEVYKIDVDPDYINMTQALFDPKKIVNKKTITAELLSELFK